MIPERSLRAAGALFVSLDERMCLLLQRSFNTSHPGKFSFVGGKINQSESIEQGLMREIQEEIGFIPSYSKITTIDNYLSRDSSFLYSSRFITVQELFVPRLNHESSGFGWFRFNEFPKNLHPGARQVLQSELAQKFFQTV